VGSHLCKSVIRQGGKVSALVRKTSNTENIRYLNMNFRYGELRDIESLKKAVAGIDYIFHLGGVVKAKDKQTFFEVNHLGTKNLLKAILETGNPKRLIYVSSQAAVGPGKGFEPIDEDYPPNPVTTYGRSKLLGEKEINLLADRIPAVIVRPPAVYGPGDKEILTFFKAVNYGIKPYFGDGESIFSLIYVSDLAEGIIQAAFSEKSIGKTYFLTDGSLYKWKELIGILSAVLGKKGVKVKIPVSLFLFLGTLSENTAKLFGKIPMLTREKAFELTRSNWACSSKRAMEDFGYSPKINFADGAKITAQWYKDKGWI